MRKLLITAISLLMAFGVASAEQVSVEIRADLLESPAGLEEVYATLQAHAEESCRFVVPGSRIRRFDEACAQDLLDQFVADLGHPRLTLLHLGSEDAVLVAEAL